MHACNKPTKPLAPVSMSYKIGRTIKLAGIKGATPHGLRKSWEQNVHVENIAYQKQLNGRALTEVERAYFWKETQELFEIYRENYRNLRVEKQDFKDVEERLRREYEIEIRALRERTEELERKNSELKKRLNEFTLSRGQVQDLLKRIEKLEKQAKN